MKLFIKFNKISWFESIFNFKVSKYTSKSFYTRFFIVLIFFASSNKIFTMVIAIKVTKFLCKMVIQTIVRMCDIFWMKNIHKAVKESFQPPFYFWNNVFAFNQVFKFLELY